MLTITDLSVSHSLDAADLSAVRGGFADLSVLPIAYTGIFSTPTIDVGVHTLVQGQSVAVNQAGSLGGFNASASYQVQNGVAGQVAI